MAINQVYSRILLNQVIEQADKLHNRKVRICDADRMLIEWLVAVYRQPEDAAKMYVKVARAQVTSEVVGHNRELAHVPARGYSFWQGVSRRWHQLWARLSGGALITRN